MQKVFFLALLLFPFIALTTAHATNSWPNWNPTNIDIQWNKKHLPTDPPGWYVCEGLATATYSGIANIEWQVLESNNIEKTAVSGAKWNFGYLEPQGNYLIRARMIGSATWYSEAFKVPKGCGTK